MQDHELYSVKQVAERIAAKRDVSEAQIARVIRHLAGENVIAHKYQGGGGPTAPKLWDEVGVHQIAILVELNRIGLSDALVKAASFHLNNFAERYDDGIGDPGMIEGARRPARLLEILPELKDGQSYYFHLYLIPDFFQKPGSILGGTFSTSSDGGSPHPFNCTTITVNLLPVLPLRQD